MATRHRRQLSLPGVGVAVLTTTVESDLLVAGDWSRCLASSERSRQVPAVELLAADSVLPLSPELRYRLVARVLDEVIAHSAGRLLLHAAAVADDSGRVVGLVAPSGTGKTTAAIALATGALGYVTDELLVVGPDLAVEALPKPLCVVRDDRDVKEVRGPDDLGLRAPARDRLELAGLLVLERDPDAGGAHTAPLAPAHAVCLLAGQAPGLLRHPEPLAALADVVQRVPTHVVRYADAHQLAAVVEDLLAAPPPRPVQVTPAPAPSPAADDGMDGSAHRRAPWQEAVVLDREVAVLREGTVTHLSAVASAAWLLADGRPGPALADALVEQFGPPPPGHEAAPARAVTDLVEAGLLLPPSPARAGHRPARTPDRVSPSRATRPSR